MAGETFKLNFITNGEGEFSINEPTGFDKADFVLKQDEKRYGRDVSFSGGESEFTFYKLNEHKFDLLMYYYETFGWESQIEMIITKDGVDNIIGDLNFFTATTDQLEYFTCKIVQQSSQAIVKRRKEINVDLFSDKNIDDEEITPLTTENVLIRAKPLTQNSNWETPEAYIKTLNADSSIGGDTEYYAFNPSQNLVKSGIDDSLSFFRNTIGYDKLSSINDALEDSFKLITAQNNLKDITVSITNRDFLLEPYIFGSGNGYVDYKFELRHGSSWKNGTSIVLFSGHNKENVNFTNNEDFLIEIPSLKRGDGIWLNFFYKIRQSAGSGGDFRVDTTINSMDVSVKATSTSYNTVVPSFRLYDATSQVVNSISGLGISFPIAEPNGDLYNQRLFNGNLLRKIIDKPFYISLKEIHDWLPEINGDYEIQTDGKVFFGIYEDFYRNEEIGVFEANTFEGYQKMFNKKYAINEFNYKYKKYQSQKENEVSNTFDVVHGESQWSVLNKFVENKKEIAISFVRDSFYIDEQRRKSFDLTETTSTQDDDTKFIIDTKELSENLIFQETDFLQHTYNEDTGYLKLSNTGTFSFLLLGLAVNDTFKILGSDINAGVYTIIDVSDRYIEINKGSGTSSNNGQRTTYFEYIVTPTTAPYISWGDEDFSYIDNITNSENYANLKYSIKRNIKRFYNSYLATCNMFSESPIKNTMYKSNTELSMSYGGLETIEGDDFIPDNQILSPYVYKTIIITDFNTYKALENSVREKRGYIRTFDAKGNVIKIYPNSMKYVNNAKYGDLEIIGEEKYQKSLINITYSDLGYLIINNEYRTRKIKYKNIGENFYIFDELDKLLYNPVIWNKISVNGAIPSSKEILIEWLKLIS